MASLERLKKKKKKKKKTRVIRGDCSKRVVSDVSVCAPYFSYQMRTARSSSSLQSFFDDVSTDELP